MQIDANLNDFLNHNVQVIQLHLGFNVYQMLDQSISGPALEFVGPSVVSDPPVCLFV